MWADLAIGGHPSVSTAENLSRVFGFDFLDLMQSKNIQVEYRGKEIYRGRSRNANNRFSSIYNS